MSSATADIEERAQNHNSMTIKRSCSSSDCLTAVANNDQAINGASSNRLRCSRHKVDRSETSSSARAQTTPVEPVEISNRSQQQHHSQRSLNTECESCEKCRCKSKWSRWRRYFADADRSFPSSRKLESSRRTSERYPSARTEDGNGSVKCHRSLRHGHTSSGNEYRRSNFNDSAIEYDRSSGASRKNRGLINKSLSMRRSSNSDTVQDGDESACSKTNDTLNRDAVGGRQRSKKNQCRKNRSGLATTVLSSSVGSDTGCKSNRGDCYYFDRLGRGGDDFTTNCASGERNRDSRQVGKTKQTDKNVVDCRKRPTEKCSEMPSDVASGRFMINRNSRTGAGESLANISYGPAIPLPNYSGDSSCLLRSVTENQSNGSCLVREFNRRIGEGYQIFCAPDRPFINYQKEPIFLVNFNKSFFVRKQFTAKKLHDREIKERYSATSRQSPSSWRQFQDKAWWQKSDQNGSCNNNSYLLKKSGILNSGPIRASSFASSISNRPC